MNLTAFALRRLAASVPLLLGVTLISFLLIVYAGPDVTFELISRNASAEEIARIRHLLGYDRPFLVRYAEFLQRLATLDLGASFISGEPVSALLARTVPVSLALVLPGFLGGNLVAIATALLAARHHRRWQDRLVTSLSVTAMSISFVVVVIALQVMLSSSAGLGWFPVQGWRVDGLGDYLRYAAVPTLALTITTAGYNTRFYRTVILEAATMDHVRTARAYGAGEGRVMVREVLRNCAIPIITRVLFSIPLVVVGGSLVLERYFGIPGVGRATYDAIASGDQPVLLAIVALTAIAFVIVQALADVLYRVFDPRVSLD
jgi:peptide/nickel transport system permease protein